MSTPTIKSLLPDEIYRLLKIAGKEATLKLKEMAMSDPILLELLVKVFLTDEDKICWHAGWSLFKISDSKKELLKKYLPSIIEKLPEMKHQSQRHGALRIIKNYDIKDETHQGILVDVGIKFILKNEHPPNLKYFSIVIIEKIAKQYPELINELALSIEASLPHWTTSYIIRFGKKKLIEYSNKYNS